MTLTKKIVLIVCLLSTLFMMFATSVGADGSVETSSGGVYTREPIFAPKQIMVYKNPSYHLIDTDLSVPVAVSTGAVSSNGARQESGLVNETTSSLLLEKDISSVASGIVYNSYGYSYNTGSYYIDLKNVNLTSTSSMALLFENIFIAPNLVSYDWNKIGSFTLTDYNELAPLNFSSCSLLLDYDYITDYNGETEYHHVENKSVAITKEDAVDSKKFFAKVKSALMDGLLYRDYKNGFVIQSLVLVYNGIWLTDGVAIRGDAWYQDLDDAGSTRGLEEWSKYYGDKVVQQGTHPTILQSITRGIEAIWDLNFIGQFTLGQIFSACVGIMLTVWLLKVFAGG